MTQEQAAPLAAGAAAALLIYALKAPFWASILGFAGVALATKKGIDVAAA